MRLYSQRNQGEKRSAQVLIITSPHLAAQAVLTIWMLPALSHTELPSRWCCANGLLRRHGGVWLCGHLAIFARFFFDIID